MHQLVRQVRFCVNPFLEEDSLGANSFAGKPAGEGLAVFFELGVTIVGGAERATGFVVNVLDIDRVVRNCVVPVFAERIRSDFRGGKHMGFGVLVELLKLTCGQLKGKFGKAIIANITLRLNPFRKIAIDCEDLKMIYFSEKFEFAAMHKLWNPAFSDEENWRVFGKCANPSGHGHNYQIEVTVKFPDDAKDFRIGEFEKIIDENFIRLVDHKNLNADVAYFAENIPTVENLSVFAWNLIDGKFASGRLHCVSIWETERTCATYYGK